MEELAQIVVSCDSDRLCMETMLTRSPLVMNSGMRHDARHDTSSVAL